jgi:hypothetical protein
LQVKAQAERGEAQGTSNSNGSDEKRRQRMRYEAQQRQKSAQQSATKTQQNVGRGKSRCNHAFRGLSDGGVMRMFSDGKFMGLATCTRQSARRTFHDYSLQYHPDKVCVVVCVCVSHFTNQSDLSMCVVCVFRQVLWRSRLRVMYVIQAAKNKMDPRCAEVCIYTHTRICIYIYTYLCLYIYI